MIHVYCSALYLLNIYVCTMFNFNPICTFLDMTKTSNHYEKNGYGEITKEINRT